MKALVTGVAGFIGSHIAERLLDLGWQVEGFDNLLTGREDNIDRRVVFWRGDVVEQLDWKMDAGSDLIVHCAASYHEPMKWHRDTRSNVLGCINAAIHARETGAKLVYFQTALPPVSSYAISKIAGGQYIQHALPANHLMFRLANVYGPRNLSGPVPTFYKRIRDRIPCTIVDTSRDIVYIDDVVNAVMIACDESMSGTFDVCSGTQTSIRDQYLAVLGELVTHDASRYLEQFDERTIAVPSMVSPGKDDVLPEVSVDKNVPGWSSSTGLAHGVTKAVDWYRRHGVEQTFTHLEVEKHT